MIQRSWERQADESTAAFEAFTLYRDTRPRSLRKVAKTLGKNDALIARWSKAHAWVERCQQWDNELDACSQQTQIDEVKEMKRRQIRMAIDMQTLAIEGLKLLDEALREKKKLPMSADNIVRMADIGAKLERLNRDEPSSIRRVQEVDFSNLDTEEMFTLRALLEKSGQVEL